MDRHERKEYWAEQVRRAEVAVAEARLNLERKQMLQEPGERRSFWEERRRSEAANRRLALSREKIEVVRRWTHLLEREVMEYKGGVASLAGWLQSDLHRGLALLRQWIAALECTRAWSCRRPRRPLRPDRRRSRSRLRRRMRG